MRRSRTFSLIAAGAAVFTTTPALTSGVGTASTAATHPRAVIAGPPTSAARIAFDSREPRGEQAQAVAARRLTAASNRPATARLAASLGRTGVVQLDASTGTVRIAGKLDGYLT